LFFLLPETTGWIYPAGLVLAGIYFLLLPAVDLLKTRSTEKAFALFNRASYYPLALLTILAISFLIR
jgi:4-hydroxybenzoate polyprenyltransferase